MSEGKDSEKTDYGIYENAMRIFKSATELWANGKSEEAAIKDIGFIKYSSQHLSELKSDPPKYEAIIRSTVESLRRTLQNDQRLSNMCDLYDPALVLAIDAENTPCSRQAEKIYFELINIESKLPKEYFHYAPYFRLGMMMKEENKLEDALLLMLKAWDYLKAGNTENIDYIFLVSYFIADLHQSLNNTWEAERMFRTALEIFEKAFSDFGIKNRCRFLQSETSVTFPKFIYINAKNLTDITKRLAAILSESDRWEDAVSMYTDEIDFLDRENYRNHPLNSVFRANLASLYYDLAKHCEEKEEIEDAISYYQKSMNSRMSPPRSDPKTNGRELGKCCRGLSDLLNREGRTEEADKVIRHAKEWINNK